MRYFTFFIIIIFCSCQPDIVIPDNIPDPVDTNSTPNYLVKNSDYIFDQNSLHTFELRLPDSSLAFLDSEPSAEIYTEGKLIFQGDTLNSVGIRYKGSNGAWWGCTSGNGPGFKTCTKLSMKVKINYKESSRKFYKLKKLQFHSMNHDPSQMHERLGYWLYRAAGIPAPRSVHARLVINDIYVGLFALTEQIDGQFAKYNFDDDGGNIYKEIWPLNSNGTPKSTAEYINSLKTNEDENPSVQTIKEFGQQISNASSNQVIPIISNHMDREEIISYAVIHRLVRHDDGAFHWYCFGSDCAPHNFYWYEEPNNKKLHLIPWDLDLAFMNSITNEHTVTNLKDDWGQISNNCYPFQYGLLEQKSAACDKLVSGWVSWGGPLYGQIESQYENSLFSQAQVHSLINLWASQIRNATIEANNLHSDAIPISYWEWSMEKLKDQTDYSRNN